MSFSKTSLICSVEFSTSQRSASFVEHTRLSVGPGLPPSSRLIGFTVSGPKSFLFPYFFVSSLLPCVAALSLNRSCRSFHVRQSCWPPDCEVQPCGQLVRTRDRSNMASILATLIFSVPIRLCIASTTPVSQGCLASPGSRFPLIVWHPLFRSSVGPCRTNSLTTVG